MKSRALHFLPLAFLAGTHGFALFAPYVAVVLAALHFRNVRRDRARERDPDHATALDKGEGGKAFDAGALDPDQVPALA